MPFEFVYTPYVWPFALSLLVTLLLAFVGAKTATPTSRVFALTMLALSLWTLCYSLELSSPTLDGKTFWLYAKYFGSATAPVLWLVFALYATDRTTWLTRPVRVALALVPTLTLGVVLTPGLRPLMWPEIVMRPGYPETIASHGWFFWVYAVAVYLLILAGALVFLHFYRTTSGVFRPQGLLLTLGGFLPLAGRMTEDLFGLDLIPRVDEVVFFFLGSGLLFATALFRYGALRLVPIAHDLVIHNIGAGIVVVDPNGRVLDLNPYARDLFGVPVGRGIGAPLPDVASGWTGDEEGGELAVGSDDRSRVFSVQRSAIRDRRGAFAGHAFVLHDITARRAAERELERLARTDALTGALNRRRFLELASDAFDTARHLGAPLAALLLDVDHFKKINDRFGHAAGDHALKEVARACSDALRSTDLFARYGGEEFVALLPGTPPDVALARAQDVRRAVETLDVVFDGRRIPVTLSVGLASLPAGSLEVLLARADEALYAAKANGRNRVETARAVTPPV